MPAAAPAVLVSTQQGVETLVRKLLDAMPESLHFIGSEEAVASVCPQNRTYGSVHGSSYKIDTLRNIKPMRQLLIRFNFLPFHVNKPAIWVSFG
jgi:hypothetical protein